MRPANLNPLFSAIDTLKGIGPQLSKTLGKHLGPRLIDLIWHFPKEIIDRRARTTISKAPPGQIATLELTVERHINPKVRNAPYRVICADETNQINLIFFRPHIDYLLKALPIGESIVVSGLLEDQGYGPQIIHPDYMVLKKDEDTIPKLEAIYPKVGGISSKVFSKTINQILEKLPDFDEWIHPDVLQKQNWASWKKALERLHHPQQLSDLDPKSPARLRLAYDELLANQMTLALQRQQERLKKPFLSPIKGPLKTKLLENIPFTLTLDQQTALKDIDADMQNPLQMLRLIQGDVGSGKTIVALLACANTFDGAGQVALMVPTEILATQHMETIRPFMEILGLKVTLLTGKIKPAQKQKILDGLKDGTTHLVIGTHALIQDTVTFKKLHLVIIDEQHRFGVAQRLALTQKGRRPDILVMTATPIPRTLTMATFGDLDISRIEQKPPGRKPIKTIAVSTQRLGDVMERLRHKIAAGEKIFWVCPLIEESQKLDLAAALDRFESLELFLGKGVVQLLHGRMKPLEKETIMSEFSTGKAQILVSTTVVEVGVNIPDATVMIIEHAERFGLAQLHQLRGRVGRGHKDATCILLRAPKLSKTARLRLKTLCKTENGFIIAEKDLEIRGAGELLGTKQSGLPTFRTVDFALHGAIMEMAQTQAQYTLQTDASLQTVRGQNIRLLLYLFERDKALTNLKSG